MSLGYPYPDVLPLLQLLCSVEEFIRVIGSRAWHKTSLYAFKPEADYWQVIPRYTYAECPVCRVRFSEPVNTYSLGTWHATRRNFAKNLYVYEEYPLPRKCPHFLGLHLFINLNEVPPTEVGYYNNGTGEVPFVSAEWVPDHVPAYVVLHALPICRIEGQAFVPRYTLFSLCYFSQDPERLVKEEAAKHEDWGKNDPDAYNPLTAFTFSSLAPTQAYDLAYWARLGKLGWLDFTDPELPLRIGPQSELPSVYCGIQGLRNCHTWRDGRERQVWPY